MNKDVHLT